MAAFTALPPTTLTPLRYPETKAEAKQFRKDLIARVQKEIVYSFKNGGLLVAALTRPSVKQTLETSPQTYRELATAGDKRLLKLTNSYLAGKKISSDERQKYLCNDTLYKVSERIHLDRHLIKGPSDEPLNIESIGNHIEALLEAISRDGGAAAGDSFFKEFIVREAEKTVSSQSLSRETHALQASVSPTYSFTTADIQAIEAAPLEPKGYSDLAGNLSVTQSVLVSGERLNRIQLIQKAIVLDVKKKHYAVDYLKSLKVFSEGGSVALPEAPPLFKSETLSTEAFDKFLVKYEAAEQIRQHPEDAAKYNQLGIKLSGKEDRFHLHTLGPVGKVALYKKAVELDPETPVYATNLTKFLGKDEKVNIPGVGSGFHLSGTDILISAIERKPDSPDTYQELGARLTRDEVVRLDVAGLERAGRDSLLKRAAFLKADKAVEEAPKDVGKLQTLHDSMSKDTVAYIPNEDGGHDDLSKIMLAKLIHRQKCVMAAEETPDSQEAMIELARAMKPGEKAVVKGRPVEGYQLLLPLFDQDEKASLLYIELAREIGPGLTVPVKDKKMSYEELLVKSIELDPKSSQSYLMLGELNKEVGIPGKGKMNSRALLEESIKLNPKSAKAHFLFALSEPSGYYSSHDKVTSLKKAIELESLYIEAYCELVNPKLSYHGKDDMLTLIPLVVILKESPGDIQYEALADALPNDREWDLPIIGKTCKKDLYIKAIEKDSINTGLYFKLHTLMSHNFVKINGEDLNKEAVLSKGIKLAAK